MLESKGHCSKCGDVKGFTTEERQLDDIYETGIVCPECKTFYHSYYFNDNLKQLREELKELARKISTNSFVRGSKGQAIPITAKGKKRYQEYLRLQGEYQAQYIEFQNETRSARGATGPMTNEDNLSERRAITTET